MGTKILLVVFLGLLGYIQARITLADVQEAEWELFKEQYNKSYDDDSIDSLRKQIFLDNKQIIDAHNQRWTDGQESYEMGVNRYTDLMETEFDSMFTDHDASEEDNTEFEDTELDDSDFDNDPQEHNVDWRDLGAVTPVQNEGHFNNSWAFAAAGVVESRQFVANGKLVVLSKQNLVDCARSKSRRTRNALKYIKKRGIDTEASYPYRGLAGKCHFNRRLIGAKIRNYSKVSRSEKKLAEAVAKGPVAAVISKDALRFYKSGVFHNAKCGKNADYAVLIVGYGSCQNCGEFWILKTAMGASWGEKGYMKMARNRNNLCGIASRAYYATF